MSHEEIAGTENAAAPRPARGLFARIADAVGAGVRSFLPDGRPAAPVPPTEFPAFRRDAPRAATARIPVPNPPKIEKKFGWIRGHEPAGRWPHAAGVTRREWEENPLERLLEEGLPSDMADLGVWFATVYDKDDQDHEILGAGWRRPDAGGILDSRGSQYHPYGGYRTDVCGFSLLDAFRHPHLRPELERLWKHGGPPTEYRYRVMLLGTDRDALKSAWSHLAGMAPEWLVETAPLGDRPGGVAEAVAALPPHWEARRLVVDGTAWDALRHVMKETNTWHTADQFGNAEFADAPVPGFCDLESRARTLLLECGRPSHYLWSPSFLPHGSGSKVFPGADWARAFSIAPDASARGSFGVDEARTHLFGTRLGPHKAACAVFDRGGAQVGRLVLSVHYRNVSERTDVIPDVYRAVMGREWSRSEPSELLRLATHNLRLPKGLRFGPAAPAPHDGCAMRGARAEIDFVDTAREPGKGVPFEKLPPRNSYSVEAVLWADDGLLANFL